MIGRLPNANRRLPQRTSGARFGFALLSMASISWSACGLAQPAPAASPPAGRPAATTPLAEPISPLPDYPKPDPARVALGAKLFHDDRLSGDDTRSCASCHPLDKAAMDGRARAAAIDGKPRLRNTPTLFNVAFNTSFNWDGATTTLEAHANRLITNPEVMNSSWPALLAKLHGDAEYRAMFTSTYPDGVTQANVLNAMASFERTLITPNARFDRFLRGEDQALSAEERRGYELFKAYGCIACHQGVNVGGNLFQRFGVFQDPDADSGAKKEPDPGRYAVTKIDRDRGVFRVPSLRNVALTAPYFHDGRAPTLEAAVHTMARVQLGRALSGQDVNAIVRFLHTLTGEFRGQSSAVTASRAP